MNKIASKSLQSASKCFKILQKYSPHGLVGPFMARRRPAKTTSKVCRSCMRGTYRTNRTSCDTVHPVGTKWRPKILLHSEKYVWKNGIAGNHNPLFLMSRKALSDNVSWWQLTSWSPGPIGALIFHPRERRQNPKGGQQILLKFRLASPIATWVSWTSLKEHYPYQLLQWVRSMYVRT